MSNAIDGAPEWQRAERRALVGQILANEHMAAEYLTNAFRVCRSNARRHGKQSRLYDVRGAAEFRKICVFVNKVAAVAPQVAVLHVPPVFGPARGDEAGQAATDEVVIVHDHHVAASVGLQNAGEDASSLVD